MIKTFSKKIHMLIFLKQNRPNKTMEKICKTRVSSYYADDFKILIFD